MWVCVVGPGFAELVVAARQQRAGSHLGSHRDLRRTASNLACRRYPLITDAYDILADESLRVAGGDARVAAGMAWALRRGSRRPRGSALAPVAYGQVVTLFVPLRSSASASVGMAALDRYRVWPAKDVAGSNGTALTHSNRGRSMAL